MLAAQPGVDRVENEFFDMRSDNNILYCVTNRNGLTARVDNLAFAMSQHVCGCENSIE